MGRPGKVIVDYFPHVTNTGKTIAIIEARWGNDGYAFWFKLLELLGNTSGFCYDCNSPSNWEYLLSKTKVTDEAARAMLDKLAEIEAIDAELWQDHRVWSDNFVAGVAAAFEKRKGSLPRKPVKSEFPEPETEKEEENNRKEKNRDKKEGKKHNPECPSALRPEVIPQADTVYLKAKEVDMLRQEHGEEGVRRIVEILDAYKTNCPEKCRSYRDDYKVMHAWVIPRYLEECANRDCVPRGRGQPQTFIERIADMVKEESG